MIKVKWGHMGGPLFNLKSLEEEIRTQMGT